MSSCLWNLRKGIDILNWFDFHKQTRKLCKSIDLKWLLKLLSKTTLNASFWNKQKKNATVIRLPQNFNPCLTCFYDTSYILMMFTCFFGCGINISNHLNLSDEDYNVLPLFCCAVPLYKAQSKEPSSSDSRKDKFEVKISMSHIIWRFENEWKFTGHWSNQLPVKNLFAISPTLVSCSEKRLALIDENNDVIVYTSCGRNERKLALHQIAKEKDLNDVSTVPIKDIAVEDNSLLIVDANGGLYSSGVQIPLFGTKICQVSVGKEHFLALSENGEVLSWGSGMKGQLGNGEVTEVEHPTIVAALEGLQILSICCGGWHSSAVSVSGDLYMWGWNDVGQLGFPSKALRSKSRINWDNIFSSWECQCPISKPQNPSVFFRREASIAESFEGEEKYYINSERGTELVNVQTTPKLLDFWKVDLQIRKVACGDRHTVVLLENGTVWSTGWNQFGQLGIGSVSSQDEPRLILRRAVKDVFAGGWNSVFVVSENENA